MPVKELDWDFSKRGEEDVSRHQKKIKEIIKGNIGNIISEESIITRKKGQTVKVPIRGIRDYYFKHNSRTNEENESYGLGHGNGKKGDIIGRRKNPGQGQGQGPGKGKEKDGTHKGEDYMEAEIQIDDLIQMMMEDLGLPDLLKKEVAETVIRKGWTFDSIDRHGIRSNIDKKRTVKEAIKHSASRVNDLVRETGREQSICQKAFNHCRGNYDKALALLKAGNDDVFKDADDSLQPFIGNQDLKYRTIKEDAEIHSNAVIIAMMDVSGSMTTQKKYLARSFFFWMVEFLKHRYKNVEIRFIAHTTEANLVDEHEFFYKGESGGTVCASAYDMACDLVDNHYPVNQWNVYAFHFSDGEDWDSSKTAASAKRLMDKNINMLGYGQIQDGETYGKMLLEEFVDTFNLKAIRPRGSFYQPSDGFESFTSEDDKIPFVGVVLKNKDHVLDALKAFFSKSKEKM